MELKETITDPLFPNCPIRNVIARIADRWSILILLTLEPCRQPLRYKQIKQAIPDISPKMLTQALRNLEADDLVQRHVYAEVPPRVEYELTRRARTLMPHLNNLVQWAAENISEIVNSRQKFYDGDQS